MWYTYLWKNIEDYIDNLEDPIDHASVICYLNTIENNIRCKKCKLHFQKIKKPSQFLNRSHVIQWFEDLKKDIKTQKKIKKTTNNRTPKKPKKQNTAFSIRDIK